jgi:low temperature requirement protein LtrA
MRQGRLSGLLRVRPSNRDPESGERHATWLELFFDLVFVLALTSVINRLDERAWSSLSEIAITFGLFVVVQWAWVGHTFYDTRFDPDDLPHRLLVFVAVGGAGVLALGVADVPDSRLLPVGYLIVRGALITMYLRVCVTSQATRDICTVYLTGFGAGWLTWLASFAFESQWRPVLWTVGLAIELLTPWVGLRTLTRYPVDTAHLPERIGQFTVIILGSSLTELLMAIPSPDPPPRVLLAGAAALVVPVCIWWVYTTFVLSRAARPRLRGGQIYTYLHVPYGAALLFLGWALGAVLHELARGSPHLPTGLRGVLGGSIAVWILAGTGMQWHTRSGVPYRRMSISAGGITSVVIVTALVDDPVLTLVLVPAAVVVYTIVVVRHIKAEIAAGVA